MGRAKAGSVATGRRNIQVVRVDPAELENEALFDSDSLDANANVPLSDLLATIGADGADGKIVVHRIVVKPGGARTEEWLFAGQPSGDLLNDLQSDYGAGTYNVKVYARDTDGVMAIRANKSITIGPLPASKIKAADVANAAPAPDRMAEVLAEIAKASAQREAQLFGLVQGIVTGGGASRSSMVSELKGLAESFGMIQKATPAAPGPLDMLAVLAQMMKLTRELTATPNADALPHDPETGDVGPNTLLVKGMEMFTQILTAVKSGQAAALPDGMAPPALPPPAAVVVSPAILSGHDPTPEEEDAEMMRVFMWRLVRAAKRNDPVESYADQLAGLITDEAVSVIEGAEWFAALVAIAPEAAPYQAWFARLREKLLESLTEETRADGDSSGGKSDAGDSAPAK